MAIGGTPIAALIVRVLADTSEIKESVQGVEAKLTNMGNVATKVGAMLAGAFTVAAILNFTRALIDDADALTKLHDKTQISVRGLQAMRIAGDDAGVSIEAMANAVTMLQKRLGGDDKSAVAALRDLNINVEAFKRLDGADQMARLSDAIKDISDPLRVANDLSGIFGKSWAEQLPVLKRGFAELKDGTAQMSDSSVKALDDLGDAMGRLWRSTKAALGEGVGGVLGRLMADYRSLKVLNGEGATETDIFKSAQERLAKVIPNVADATKDLNFGLDHQAEIEKKLDPLLKAHVDNTTKAAEAQKKFRDAVREATDKMHLSVTELYRYISAIPGARSGTGQLSDAMLNLTSHTFGVSGAIVGTMGNMLQFERISKGVIDGGIIPLAEAITGRLSDALSQIPKLFVDAFTGKGGVIGALKAIGVSLLDAITHDVLQPVWDAVAGWVVGIARQIAGAFMGHGFSMPSIGGLGALFGGGGGLGIGSSTGMIGAGAGAGGGLGAGLAGFAAAGGLVTGGVLAALPMIIAGFNNPTIGNTMGGNGMTIREAIVAHNRMSPDQQQAEFARLNPELAAAMAAEAAGNSFAGGSGGMRNFGRGQLAMLHGREEVRTEAQANQDSAMAEELKGLRRDLLYSQPQLIAKQVAIALAKHGGRRG